MEAHPAVYRLDLVVALSALIFGQIVQRLLQSIMTVYGVAVRQSAPEESFTTACHARPIMLVLVLDNTLLQRSLLTGVGCQWTVGARHEIRLVLGSGISRLPPPPLERAALEMAMPTATPIAKDDAATVVVTHRSTVAKVAATFIVTDKRD